MPNYTRIVLTGADSKTRQAAIDHACAFLQKCGFPAAPVYLPDYHPGITAGEIVDSLRTEDKQNKLLLEAFESSLTLIYENGETGYLLSGGEAFFSELCEQLGTVPAQLRDGYEAVLHLDAGTPADAALVHAWVGTPHYCAIPLEVDAADADQAAPRYRIPFDRLERELLAIMGEEERYEIERKFLIELPDIAQLSAQPNCRAVEIEQTYLTKKGGFGRRVRKRGSGAGAIYFYTMKKRINEMRRIEHECRIDEETYLQLLTEWDKKRRTLKKTRYVLIENGRTYEIDVFSFLKKTAILEIELTREDEPFAFPSVCRVIREVTNDPAYLNSNLAKSRGKGLE